MFRNKADVGLCEKQRFIYYFIHAPCLYYLFLHLLTLFPSNYSMPSSALNAISNFSFYQGISLSLWLTECFIFVVFFLPFSSFSFSLVHFLKCIGVWKDADIKLRVINVVTYWSNEHRQRNSSESLTGELLIWGKNVYVCMRWFIDWQRADSLSGYFPLVSSLHGSIRACDDRTKQALSWLAVIKI